MTDGTERELAVVLGGIFGTFVLVGVAIFVYMYRAHHRRAVTLREEDTRCGRTAVL